MKTSEFKKMVKELGFKVVDETPNGISVRTIHNELVKAIVSRVLKDTLLLNTTSIKLMKLCIEYAETPIEEREEEKKYRVRIPDSPERTPVYALCKLVNGCVVINQTNESNFQEYDRYRLTEAEIKRNHEYLWQFAKEVHE